MKRYKFNVEITLDTNENVNNDLTDEELNNSFIEGFRELLNDEVGYICKVNVKEDLKWQKLKEWLEEEIKENQVLIDPYCKEIEQVFIAGGLARLSEIQKQMQELEGEDE